MIYYLSLKKNIWLFYNLLYHTLSDEMGKTIVNVSLAGYCISGESLCWCGGVND